MMHQKLNMSHKTNNSVFILFKRGKPEHILRLFERGEVYINTIDYIRNCDINEDLSDSDDSILEREFWGDIQVNMCDVGFDINKNGISFEGFNGVINTDSTLKGNIYCLSGIYTKEIMDDNEIIELNTKKSFGESIIIIFNPRIFIERVKKALIDKGYEKVYYKPVTYYSNNYSGKVGFFRKHEKFSPQNEFRFFIPNKKNETITIEIGSLKEIAVVRHNGCFLKAKLTDSRTKIFKFL